MVIAIIGILSSVVLASLTTARSRGTAAAVQNELSNMRAQAELFYSTTGSYGTAGDCSTGTLFTSANGLKPLLDGIAAKSITPTCVASGTPAQAWAVTASAGSDYFCVDSKGVSKKSTTTIAVTGGVCN